MHGTRRCLAPLTALSATLLFAPSALALDFAPLAELPEPGGYVSPIRVILILIMILPWLAFCQWVDKDAHSLRRMNRELWDGVVLGGGVLGLALWLLPPWATPGQFAAGFGLWFLITVGTCGIYVIVRNGMVDHSSRVFTPHHIKTYLSSLGKKKGSVMDAVERVRLSAHSGAKVPPPTDPNKTDAYEAAQTLLFDALWRRATDVELMISSNGPRLAYKIDGVPTARHDLLTSEQAQSALVFIKEIAGLDIEERRRPQDGSISGAITGGDGGATEVEVRSSGTTQHERLTLRIVGEQHRLRIADLGLPQKQQEQFDAIAAKPSGLVIVSGPRASGVTTTLYAALRQHDAFMQNLLTLEHSPLMELENITQHIFDAGKHEASYARQLQTVLRREPDVVMISDCPDRETAHLAARAAVDGKKIYMGIQAKDSFEALKKLVSLAGDTDAVAAALLAITSQRLVRKLCIACRQAYKPDALLLKKANLPVDKIEHFYRPPPEGFVDAKGRPVICPNCQASGYYGRTGVFEILEVDESIRDFIRHGQPVSAIRSQARKTGMLYLQESALEKVKEGVTSMNEVLRVMRDEEPPRRQPAVS